MAVWLEPEARAPVQNSVWTYDFVHDRLTDKTAVKLLCVLDECPRECLAIEVARSMNSITAIDTRVSLMHLHGKPCAQPFRPGRGAHHCGGDALVTGPERASGVDRALRQLLKDNRRGRYVAGPEAELEHLGLSFIIKLQWGTQWAGG